MTEQHSSNPSVHTDLIATGCGLHANVQNPDFHPGSEARAKWAQLMFAGADEIERLAKERDYWKDAQGTMCRVELELRACITGMLKARVAEPNDMIKSLLYNYDLWPMPADETSDGN
jgi:hypothetical protein